MDADGGGGDGVVAPGYARGGGSIARGTIRQSLVDGAEHAVREWVRPGRFREGDRLPTEAQLAKMLGISRGTLRGALRRLEDSGEIVRRQGSGTFVGRLASGPDAGVPWLRADSYATWARAGALTVTAMSVDRAPAGAPAGEALQIPHERVTVHVRRVYTAGGANVGITHDVLNPDLPLPDAGQLHDELSRGGTVHALIVAMTGIAFSLRRTRIAARLVAPGDSLGRLLGLSEPVACVTLEDVSSGDGRPILYSEDTVVPGQVEIEVVQSAGETLPEPIVARELVDAD